MVDLASLLPPDVSPMAAALVIAASFFTSALTAAFSLGGGLALVAIMSALLPANAVIPIHAIAQLGSNAGRFGLQRKYVIWQIAVWFAAGSILGAVVGVKLFIHLPDPVLKAIIGVFVLLAIWGPKPRGFSPGTATFFATGAASALLSVFVGATGPIAAAMMKVAQVDKLKTVATHAACMTFQHALKALAFGFAGFAYREWAGVIIAILISGFAGTIAGTRLLRAMPERQFRSGFIMLLTFFACYLITSAIFS